MNAKIVENQKVRYAVVGAGWTAQANFLPGVEHTGNSELTTLVTGSPEKAEALGERYHFAQTFSYEEYNDMLASDQVDAVYVALPNFAHVDFAVRTLDAGVHLLLEGPMAASVAQCERILAAAARSGARLMIAYRLHYEPGMLSAVRAVRERQFGHAVLFNSTFCQQIAPSNHRASHGFWAGPVPEMGLYPINTARTLFDAEPTEVFATGVRTDPARFNFDDTVAVTLKFPGTRIAAFTVSYNAGEVDDFRIVGTSGDLYSQPAYHLGVSPEHIKTIGELKHSEKFPRTDQFAGELKYFSDCILRGCDPEPNGEEGLLDVRVMAAIESALKTGQVQKLEPYQRTRRASEDQVEKLRPVRQPDLIGAEKPSVAC
jgi:predicted dehydrogenase